MTVSGKLVGVGVGPGDPELITIKAVRVLKQADLVAHFAKAAQRGNAWTIAARYLKPAVRELCLVFPVTTELPRHEATYCDIIRGFYDTAAGEIAAHLDEGCLVAVVCEGDPLFYGSYMHLHVRLASRFRTEIVAGVSGMSGCWSAVGTPMAQGDDVFSVVPGTLAQDELERRIIEADAVVLIKLGRHLPKVRRALERTGRLERAVYVERGTMTGEMAIPLAAKPDDCAPYFAVVLVPGWERRI
ncbi:MAG: precorrin-2 C(20)-methyltransferase [Alphaproteobacteria bacterium]|nr:MAG: precorrin-2 C(20)-methyltransferase [Alphaproteobacteria bacterium]TMJ98772.1 MAG: precorrin-2 C(20)-methyltransferase [Alphaproteobacteria bacterium]TMK04357.1 MAG: precorrin-2 C(20)-methyltransferase [Alphaproteobacteria bacterium]